MKRIYIFISLCLLTLLFTACAPLSQGLVQLPDELAQWVGIVVQIAVVFVITQLLKRGFDFTGYTAQVAAAITSAVIVVINTVLAGLPPNLETIVTILFNILVVVVGSFGTYKVYRQALAKARG